MITMQQILKDLGQVLENANALASDFQEGVNKNKAAEKELKRKLAVVRDDERAIKARIEKAEKLEHAHVTATQISDQRIKLENDRVAFKNEMAPAKEKLNKDQKANEDEKQELYSDRAKAKQVLKDLEARKKNLRAEILKELQTPPNTRG